jgi:carbonic anhydrase
VQPILPAVIDARASMGTKTDLVDHAIHMNVSHVVKGLRQASDPILADPIKAGKVRVVGAYYDLDTGAVDFFDRV